MSRRSRIAVVWVALSMNAVVGFGANQVFVVSPSGSVPGSFASVQAAIDAATDGDLIRVKPGSYSGFTLAGKSLTIIGESTSPPPTQNIVIFSSTITAIGANQRVLLRSIRILGGSLSTAGLTISNCVGPVILEETAITQGGSLTISEQPMVLAQNSARILLTRCFVHGNDRINKTLPIVFPHGCGLAVAGSTVSAYETTIQGGTGSPASSLLGGNPNIFAGTPGGPGVLLFSGSLFVSGSSIIGGTGGVGGVDPQTGTLCVDGEPGGTGIVIGGAFTQLDSTIAGGAPGGTPPACLPGSAAGIPVIFATGSSTLIAEENRTVSVSAPMFEGQSATFRCIGAPGEICVLLLSFSPSRRLGAGRSGHSAADFACDSRGARPLAPLG